MPLIAATPWRRTLPTFLHPETDLYTIDPALYGEQNAGSGVPPIVDERGITTDSSDIELFQAALVADRFLANRHTVTFEPDSIVHGLFGETEVDTNSMHHQSIDRLARDSP